MRLVTPFLLVAVQQFRPGGHAMLRAFTDSAGVEWRVWDVLPSAAASQGSVEAFNAALTQTVFANGWLCFESDVEKRRLAPIPAGWEFQEAPRLEQLRQQATPVPLRQQRVAQTAV